MRILTKREKIAGELLNRLEKYYHFFELSAKMAESGMAKLLYMFNVSNYYCPTAGEVIRSLIGLGGAQPLPSDDTHRLLPGRRGSADGTQNPTTAHLHMPLCLSAGPAVG